MAERRGLRLEKSRRRDPGALDFGGYVLVKGARTVFGSEPRRFSASLEDVERFLAEYRADGAMKRTIAAVTLAGLAIAASGGASDASDLTEAAFRCAALAMHGGTAADAPGRTEAERLFRVGAEHYRATWPEWGPILRDALNAEGSTGSILADQGVDFWMGMTWAEAASQIGNSLEEQVPYRPGVDWEAIKDLRESAALGEFRQRNCDYIGGSP